MTTFPTEVHDLCPEVQHHCFMVHSLNPLADRPLLLIVDLDYVGQIDQARIDDLMYGMEEDGYVVTAVAYCLTGKARDVTNPEAPPRRVVSWWEITADTEVFFAKAGDATLITEQPVITNDAIEMDLTTLRSIFKEQPA